MPGFEDDPQDDDNQGPVYGSGPDHDAEEQPSGARGGGTEHGLGGKLKQAANAVTGRDLHTASPAENEGGAEAGAGGNDGR